ncbi:crotonase/enoyl-CoA hydratase family protein [Ilumatobacter sp.]|uniref:crotonase/enoyl-CoA hydratase family protein n=1 Tax=Ilumatobacter sp. TaxID=1967498 RepID=UPI003AF5E6C0
MSDRVTVSITDGIADVRFNRADKRNALDGAQFAAIEAVGEELKHTPGLRVVVLSGEGESFCAGLDFAMFSGMAGDGERDSQGNPGDIPDGRITHRGQQICWVWQELAVPVIAAVHGHALGGGFQIAMGADIRIAHPDTTWSVREVHWGLVPDMTGTFMLSRLVRSDIARELTYTARMVDGREAFDLGLCTRLSDHPYEDAMALAREIAARSPGAVQGSKAAFNNLFARDAAEQFELERRLIGEQIGTKNQVEAIMSNMEKRAPDFVD